MPTLIWYSECLSNSYIHTAYIIMIFFKNCKKVVIFAYIININRVPTLLVYIECLLYYNLPLWAVACIQLGLMKMAPLLNKYYWNEGKGTASLCRSKGSRARVYSCWVNLSYTFNFHIGPSNLFRFSHYLFWFSQLVLTLTEKIMEDLNKFEGPTWKLTI